MSTQAAITIRQVHAADAAAICDIYNPFILDSIITFEFTPVAPQEMAERIAKITADYPWIVAESEGRIVGYAYASRWRTRAAYDQTAEVTVYVPRGQERRGIGRALYADLLGTLRTRGFHVAIGGISLPNPASVALHEQMGFKPVAHYPQVGRKFDAWVDVGFWQLMLAEPSTAR